MIYVQEMTMTVFTIISIENILMPSMFKYARWIGLKISFNRITMYEDAESSPIINILKPNVIIMKWRSFSTVS